MGKALELKMGCGCEVWTGSDYDGIPYVLIEHCSIHEVRVEELEFQQQKDTADQRLQCPNCGLREPMDHKCLNCEHEFNG